MPVSGSTGPYPEINTNPLATTAWEKGPAGAGPFSAITVFFIVSSFMDRAQTGPATELGRLRVPLVPTPGSFTITLVKSSRNEPVDRQTEKDLRRATITYRTTGR